MTMSEDLRASYTQRVSALEGSTRRLLAEIADHLPPERRRDLVRTLRAKVDVLYSALEESILVAAGLLSDEDLAVDQVHELSDAMIETRAKLDRRRRKLHRALEEIELKEQKLATKHVADEIDAELEE